MQVLQSFKRENPDNCKNSVIFQKKCSKAQSMSRINTSPTWNRSKKHLRLSKTWGRKKNHQMITVKKGGQSLLRKAMILTSRKSRVKNKLGLFKWALNLTLRNTRIKWPDTATTKLKCLWILTWHILKVKTVMPLTEPRHTWQIRISKKSFTAEIKNKRVHPSLSGVTVQDSLQMSKWSERVQINGSLQILKWFERVFAT